MTSSEVWDEGTASRHEADSSEMFRPEVLDPTVEFLARLAGSGSALEFAIGTGRVAIPLAERGIPVTGVELSRPMVMEEEYQVIDTYDLLTQEVTSHHVWMQGEERPATRSANSATSGRLSAT